MKTCNKNYYSVIVIDYTCILFYLGIYQMSRNIFRQYNSDDIKDCDDN
jgi:hypothetical protein